MNKSDYPTYHATQPRAADLVVSVTSSTSVDVDLEVTKPIGMRHRYKQFRSRLSHDHPLRLEGLKRIYPFEA